MLLLHRPVEIKPCAQTVSREAHEIDTGTFRRAASLDVPVSASIGLPETVCAQGAISTGRCNNGRIQGFGRAAPVQGLSRPPV